MDFSNVLETQVDNVISEISVSQEEYREFIKLAVLREIENTTSSASIARLRQMYMRMIVHEAARARLSSPQTPKRIARKHPNLEAERILIAVSSYYTPLTPQDSPRVIQSSNRQKVLELKQKGITIDFRASI